MEAKTCIRCGKEGKYISFKYASPLCEKCAEEEVKKIAIERGLKFAVDVEDFYTEDCEERYNVKKVYTMGQ